MLLEEIDWEIEHIIENTQYLHKISSSHHSKFNLKLLKRYNIWKEEAWLNKELSFTKLTKLAEISWNDIRRYLRDKIILVEITKDIFHYNEFKHKGGIENFVPAEDVDEVIKLKDINFDAYNQLPIENIRGVGMVLWDLVVLFINIKIYEFVNFYDFKMDL